MLKEQKTTDVLLHHITARYITDVQAGRHPQLGDYLVHYPQHASALVDFVAYYHTWEVPVVMLPSTPDMAESDPGQATIFCTTVTGQRLSPEHVATQLGIGKDMLKCLEQRKIKPETIPLTFCIKLAALLEVPAGAVQAYLLNEQASWSAQQKTRKIAEGQSMYRISSQEQRTFRACIETCSELSSSQKARWYAILAAEQIE